jgi:Kef-type K+ transport system membrane component KefB
MTNATWFLVVGSVLLFMALTATRIKRLPLSSAIVYLAVGIVLGPTFANQFHFNPMARYPSSRHGTKLEFEVS